MALTLAQIDTVNRVAAELALLKSDNTAVVSRLNGMVTRYGAIIDAVDADPTAFDATQRAEILTAGTALHSALGSVRTALAALGQ